MIPLLIAACWLVTVAFVAVLCLAARRGDLQPQPAVWPVPTEEASEPLAADEEGRWRRARHADAPRVLADVGGAAR